MTPFGVIRPIFPPANSPNQMLPSAPSAIARGILFGVGMSNSAIVPSGAIRPMRLPVCSENHILPSEPSAMMRGELLGFGRGNSLRPVPSGFIRPMRLPCPSVNQAAPSAASAMVVGPLPGFGSGYSVQTPSVVRFRSVGASHRCWAPATPADRSIPRTHSHLRVIISVPGTRPAGRIARYSSRLSGVTIAVPEGVCRVFDRRVFWASACVLALVLAASIRLVAGREEAERDAAQSSPAGAAARAQSPAPAAASPAAGLPDQALVQKYCATCHNDRAKTGGVSFEGVSVAEAGTHSEIWEKALVKLRGGMMPPQGMPRPDDTAMHAFIVSLENTLDAQARKNQDPGFKPVHRLNRTEY